MEQPIESLYNTLSKGGYDLGDFKTFGEKMANPEKAKILHDTITKDGYDVGDFNSFSNKLGIQPSGVLAPQKQDFSIVPSINTSTPIKSQQSPTNQQDVIAAANAENDKFIQTGVDENPKYLKIDGGETQGAKTQPNFLTSQYGAFAPEKESVPSALKPNIEPQETLIPKDYYKEHSIKEPEEETPGILSNKWLIDTATKTGAEALNIPTQLEGLKNKAIRGVIQSLPESVAPYVAPLLMHDYSPEHEEGMKGIVKGLNDISNTYKNKSISDLYDNKDYLGIAGKVTQDGIASIPMVTAAMAAPEFGLPLIGATTANEKYDSLADRKDMSENQKAVNAVTSGIISAGSLYLMGEAGKYLGSVTESIGKVGSEEASKLLKTGLSKWMTETYLKHGITSDGVLMAAQGAAAKIADNTVDYATGAKKEYKPFDGVGEALSSNFVTGLGFGTIGSLSKIPVVNKAEIAYTGAERNLFEKLNNDGFTQEEITATLRTLKVGDQPIRQEIANQIINRSTKDIQSTSDAIGDYINSVEQYKSVSSKAYFNNQAEQQQFIDEFQKAGKNKEAQKVYQEQQKQKAEWDKNAEEFGLPINGTSQQAIGNGEVTESAQQIDPLQQHIDEINKNVADHVTAYHNPDMGAVVSAKLVGTDEPIQVTGGKIVQNPDGTINNNESDKAIYYKDENGVTQVIGLDKIEGISEITPLSDAIQQTQAIATAPLIAQQENTKVRPYEQGEEVRINQNDGTTPFGKITGTAPSGNYIFTEDRTGQQTEVEPRSIINEDNIKGIENGDTVSYIDQNGQLKQGEIKFNPQFRKEGYVEIDGNPEPIDSIQPKEIVQESSINNKNVTNSANFVTNSSTLTPNLDTSSTEPAVVNTEPQAENKPENQYPLNKKGEIDFDSMTDQQAFDYKKETKGEEAAIAATERQINRAKSAIQDNIRATQDHEGNLNKQLAKASSLQEEAKIEAKMDAKKLSLQEERKSLDERISSLTSLLPARPEVQAPSAQVEKTKNLRPEYAQLLKEQEVAKQQEVESAITKQQNTTLSEQQAIELISSFENNAETAPNLDLTQENWNSEFGESGIVATPIGDVKMGENQFSKLQSKKRSNEFGMIKPTLTRPDVVLEENDPKENSERDTKLIFVKTFTDSTGSKHIHFESVTVKKGSNEVVISSHIINKNALQNKLQGDNVFYINKELTPIGSEMRLAENQNGMPDIVPTQETNSENKDNILSSENQTNSVKNNKHSKFQKRIEALGDYTDVEDFILRKIAGGLKFKWNTEGVKKGVADELGFAGKEGERKARIGMTDNINGITPQELAHSIWNEYGENGDLGVIPGMHNLTDHDVLNIVNDVLRTTKSSTDALNQAEANHFDMSEEEYAREMQAPFSNEEADIVDSFDDDMLASYLGIKGFTEEQLNELESILKGYGQESAIDRGTETGSESISSASNAQDEIKSSSGGKEEISGQQSEPKGVESPTQAEADTTELDNYVKEQEHNSNPTEKQKETGIYDKARINLQHHNITLETLKGEQRSGVDSNGKEWSITMNNHYGELDGTIGYDGDPIDVFIGPDPKQGQIFVIDQNNEDGSFDESKVMLGFDSAEQAKESYLSNYEAGWKGFGSITPAGDNFKKWLYDGAKQRKPFAEYKDTPEPVMTDAEVRDEYLRSDLSRELDSADVPPVAENELRSRFGIEENRGEKLANSQIELVNTAEATIRKKLGKKYPELQVKNKEKSFEKSRKETTFVENKSDELQKSIPQGEHGEEIQGTRRTEELKTELERRSAENTRNARENSQELSEREVVDILNKTTEDYAKEKGIWIPLKDINKLGEPSVSGYENDVFLDAENGFMYKVNNLLYNEGNVLKLIDSSLLHNSVFPETAYEIVGFTGFDNGTVYPILKQRYIANAIEASPKQISEYMQSIGFKKITDSKYTDGAVTVSDLLPRNVLVKENGSIYVIDDNVKSNLTEQQVTPENKSQQTTEAEAKQTKVLDSITGGEYSKTKAANEQAQTNEPSPIKIEDFGEKISGAKKDTYQRLEQTTKEDIASMPLSKSFPRPNFKSLVEGGELTQDGAILTNFMYDLIPAKPRQQYAIDRWVKKVQQGIDTFKSVLESPEQAHRLIEEVSKANIGGFQMYYDIHKALGFPQNPVKLGNYSIKDFSNWSNDKGEKTGRWSIVNGSIIVKDFNSKDEALDGLRKLMDEKNNAVNSKTTKFDIYRDRKSQEVFIGKKTATGVKRVLGGFESSKEANNFRKEKQQELEAIWDSMKSNINERRDNNSPRVGTDYRQGKDVQPEQFADTFGFRGVQFGNWVNGPERQQSLNEAFDAIMDLATVTGIPPRAVSLNGELGLAFGARGHGKAMAHYESGEVVINLTKTKGAGTFAHEWWHALDNYFSRMRGEKSNFFTVDPRQKLTKEGRDQRVRKEVADAFNTVVNTIIKTEIPQRSEELDSTRSKLYWSTIEEMSARAFEDYVIHKMAETGESNDYLANFRDVSEYGNDVSSYPYPLPDESADISKAFNHLFDTMKIDDKGTLYQFDNGKLIPATSNQVSDLSERLLSTGLAKEVKMVTPEEIKGILGYKPSGSVNGFVKDGIVYLNADKPNLNTPIHEFGHLFTPIIKEQHPEFYQKGAELIKESPYYESVKNDPNYSHLDEDGIIDEAMNQAIGDKGEKAVKDKGLFDRLKEWIKGVWERIGAKFGIKNLTPEQIENLTLEDWTDIVNSELLSGEQLERAGVLDPNTLANKSVEVVTAKRGFKNLQEATEYANEHFKEDGKWKSYTNKDSGDVLELSSDGIKKTISNEAVNKSVSREDQMKAFSVLDKILEESILAEVHSDKNDSDHVKQVRRYYGALNINGIIYRVKTTVKAIEIAKKKTKNKYYSLEVQEMELLEQRSTEGIKGHAEATNPNNSSNSISGANLLQGVTKSNSFKLIIPEDGVKLQIIGEKGADNLDKRQEATTRIDNLGVAKEMESTKTPQEIRLATGWEKGKDGLWRYEVNDEAWTPEFLQKLDDSSNYYADEKTKGANTNLSDIFGEKSDILKTYPQLDKTDVFINIHPDNKGNGHFLKGTSETDDHFGTSDEIRINAKNIESAKSLLVHEIQHAIQEIEGFAKGGSIETDTDSNAYETYIHNDREAKAILKAKEDYKDSDLAKRIEENVNNTNEWIKLLSERSNDPEWKAIVTAETLFKKENKLFPDQFLQKYPSYKSSAYQNYLELAGETESRNAQTRMNFTDEQRREKLLSSTEDVAREDQIVLMDGMGISEARMEKPKWEDYDGDMIAFTTDVKKYYDLQVAKTKREAKRIEKAKTEIKNIKEPQIKDFRGRPSSEYQKARTEYFNKIHEINSSLEPADKKRHRNILSGLKIAKDEIINNDTPELQKLYRDIENNWLGTKDVENAKAMAETIKLQKDIKESVKGTKTDWRDIDKAIHIYNDMKNDPEAHSKYYSELTDQQKRIADIAINLTDDQKEIADRINSEYVKIGQSALDESVISNLIDNYVRRTWDLSNGENSKDFWSKFSTSTSHSKQRKLGSILEGQAGGLNLKTEGATNNLQALHDEIHAVISNKHLMDAGLKTKAENGVPLFSLEKDSGYEEIKHPNFRKWVKQKNLPEGADLRGENWAVDKEGQVFEKKKVYAPKPIADRLNNILGESKLKDTWGIKQLTKFNAIVKTSMLSFSFYHHQAFLRNYYLASTINKDFTYNPVKAYKAGYDMFINMAPELETLVKNGMTLGRVQDWEENLVEEKNFISNILDKNKVSKTVSDKIMDLHKKQTDFLFKEFGLGLKVKCGVLEYNKQIRMFPEEDPNLIAKRVGELMNNMFGGLNLERMGRDKTMQHIARLFLLATDWTESNIKTLIKAFGWDYSKDQKGSEEYEKAERRMYQKLLAKTIIRSTIASTFFNMAISATFALWQNKNEDPEDTWWKEVEKIYHRSLDPLLNFRLDDQSFMQGFRTLRDFAVKAHFADADITPFAKATNKLFGKETDDNKAYYFSIAGHYKDAARWIEDPSTSVKHKGSVITSIALDAITGKDWQGKRFTTIDELLGMDDKGLYSHSNEKKGIHVGDKKGGKLVGQFNKFGNPYDNGSIQLNESPSFVLGEIRRMIPVPFQGLMNMFQGEMDGFTTVTRGIGGAVSSENLKDPNDSKLSRIKLEAKNTKIILSGIQEKVQEMVKSKSDPLSIANAQSQYTKINTRKHIALEHLLGTIKKLENRSEDLSEENQKKSEDKINLLGKYVIRIDNAKDDKEVKVITDELVKKLE